MKKNPWIALVAIVVLILSCSKLSLKPIATPHPTFTATKGLLIATFTPQPASTETPTEVPTETPTEIPTLGLDKTATIENTPVSRTVPTLAIQVIYGLSLSVSVSPVTCSGKTPGKTTVTFTGSIGTNYAATVRYKWIITGTSNFASTIRSYTTDNGQIITVKFRQTLECGSYTAGLQIISPNPVTEKKNFTIP